MCYERLSLDNLQYSRALAAHTPYYVHACWQCLEGYVSVGIRDGQHAVTTERIHIQSVELLIEVELCAIKA